MAIHVWDIHGYAMIYPIFRHLGAQAAAVPHAALGIEAAGAVPPWNRPQNHWASSKSGSVWEIVVGYGWIMDDSMMNDPHQAIKTYQNKSHLPESSHELCLSTSIPWNRMLLHQTRINS